MNNPAFTFISDPGHGWLVVPLADVQASGYEPTEFSFIKGTTAYLEEDVDASGFLAAIDPGYTLHYEHVDEFRRPARRFPA